MRIVHVTDFYLPRVGGIEQQVQQLAAAQAAAGHEVHVVTATIPRQRSPEPAVDRAVTVHRLPRDGRPHVGLLAGPRALRAVGRTLISLDPDVVHVHSSVVSPLALAAALFAGRARLPTVVTVHSMWAHLTGPYRRLFAAIGLSGLPICWTAVSEVAATQVRAAIGNERRLQVLPNGIDPELWPPTPRPPQGAGAVEVVSVLRFAPRKRPLAIARALRQARATVPADIVIRATLVGGGPLRAVVSAYLRLHRMPWVELTGTLPQEEVRAVVSRAELFISAARLESFGIAALEARCAGVPVVTMAGTGITDFVGDGVEGIVVADDRELAGAISRLISAPDVCAAMAATCRRTPPAMSWPITMAASQQLYRAAAGLTGRPEPAPHSNRAQPVRIR